MKSEELKALKKLRADLMLQVNALDSAISLLEQVTGEATSDKELEMEMPSKRIRGKTKNTTFESTIDLSKIPDYNPRGGGIRTDT